MGWGFLVAVVDTGEADAEGEAVAEGGVAIEFEGFGRFIIRVRVWWNGGIWDFEGEVVAVTVVVMWETGCCELI